MGRRDLLESKTWLAIAALSAACLLSGGWLRAQAPPGPLAPAQPVDSGPPAASPKPQAPKPPAQPRPSIFGAWRFNRDESDDPGRKVQEARQSSSNGGYGGNRRMGGGYPGGGYPGGGGYGGRRMGGQGESDDDRQRMQELLNPSSTVTLAEAQKDAEIDLFDDQQRKRAFFMDGRKLQKSKDANYQEIAAHWDGSRLVTDEKGPRSGKMSRTYELSYDRTQLYETLHFTIGRSNTPVTIRYVYDQGPGSAAAAPSASSSPPPAHTP